LKHITSP